MAGFPDISRIKRIRLAGQERAAARLRAQLAVLRAEAGCIQADQAALRLVSEPVISSQRLAQLRVRQRARLTELDREITQGDSGIAKLQRGIGRLQEKIQRLDQLAFQMRRPRTDGEEDNG